MTQPNPTQPDPTQPSQTQQSGVPSPSRRGLLSRRGFVAGAGAVGGLIAGGGAATAVAAGGGGSTGGATDDPGRMGAADTIDLARSVPFYTGLHQAGIETPPQRYCVFMTFDLTSRTSRDLQILLARWSAAIAQLMAGEPIGAVQPTHGDAVAADTGEALDLGPSSLTVTLGLGPGVFGHELGLAHAAPRLLRELPQLPSDNLDRATTGGDLSLQACADDPQVAYHAIRDLARMGRGVVDTRWTVMGFGRASAGHGQSTPRNLQGFKDGTRNLKEPAELDRFVWAKDDADWMNGGSYQVARKIRMNIETWDSDRVDDQERVIGRAKTSGAPLSGTHEFDTPDFTARHHGEQAISPVSHIALAAHENNGGIRILRRSYNYTDGINPFGQLDAGLLFIAYMNDPDHFVRLQTRLGSSDLLNEYISHIGSAVFAVPPAPKPGGYLAEGLFG
jgi:deferrochelatase/peroxidase EfeB